MTAIATVGTTPGQTVDVMRQRLNDTIGRWNNLGTYDAIQITGGAIDGTPIGVSSSSTGKFTNLTATGTVTLSGATVIFANNQLTGDYISGGTITNATVELSGPPSIGVHAATKTYVDTADTTNTNAIQALNASLAPVATAGTYASLTGKPTISTVGSSGAYADLTGKPTLGTLAALSTVATANITAANVTYAKIQNLSAQYTMLARTSSGAGSVEELTSSADVFSFLGQSSLANMRTNLGMGTAALVDTGTTNGRIPVIGVAGLSRSVMPNGTIIQTAYNENTTWSSMTATIPFDDTIPQISEGTQILAATITPTFSSSRIRIRVQIWGWSSVGPSDTLALFVDGGANAIAATGRTGGQGANYTSNFTRDLVHEYVPGDTSSHTYSVNVGPSSGTIYINGSNSTRLFGGVGRCTITVEEIKA